MSTLIRRQENGYTDLLLGFIINLHLLIIIKFGLIKLLLIWIYYQMILFCLKFSAPCIFDYIDEKEFKFFHRKMINLNINR